MSKTQNILFLQLFSNQNISFNLNFSSTNFEMVNSSLGSLPWHTLNMEIASLTIALKFPIQFFLLFFSLQLRISQLDLFMFVYNFDPVYITRSSRSFALFESENLFLLLKMRFKFLVIFLRNSIIIMTISDRFLRHRSIQ